MKSTTSISGFHGVFNARWMSPEDVARQFVPISQFTKLTHSRHSLLLGPRGSGKTTLLKMLTRRAQEVWEREREEEAETPPFERPLFEAVYVPSDVRWSYELRSLDEEPPFSDRQTELTQRFFVQGSTLVALCDAFEWYLPRLSGHRGDQFERKVGEAIIKLYHLSDTLPFFSDIRTRMGQMTSQLRGIVNRGDPGRLKNFLEYVPDFMLGHTLDAPISACSLLSRILVNGERQGPTWALCYDELEIAPKWMRQEVLEGYRSTDQSFLIKATYSPLLPTGIRTAPEPAQDFQRIRLWHSHVQDARVFCEDLATRFLSQKFPGLNVTPDTFLRYSALAAGESSIEEDPTSYERNSNFFNRMVDLAREDRSFARVLRSRGIDPSDPFSETQELRDTFFRKIKPVVLLRNAFQDVPSDRGRSRKVYTVYAGKEAVYSMSEGNPRWLLGLLTDLHDRWQVTRYCEATHPRLLYNDQARILNATARRYQTSLAATPIPDDHESGGDRLSLVGLLDSIGDAISQDILAYDFPVDPYGSFWVEGPVPRTLQALIEKGLETGSLVYIGKSEEDVPQEIANSRFRLSFMLSPVYKLPFRNYRAISLSRLLSRGPHPDQLSFYDGPNGGGRR